MNRFDIGISLGEPISGELLKGHLGKLDVPSLESLSHSHGVDIPEFPRYFRERVEQTFQQVGKSSFVSNNEWFIRLNFLYQTWSATRDTSKYDLFPGFADSLSTYDNFMQTYGKGVSLQQSSEFNFWVKWFTERVVHPERILELHSPKSKDFEVIQRGIYKYQGSWHSIPSNSDMNVFVEDGVIREICGLNDTLRHAEADLFHVTGSAALIGISKHQALLSARESEKRGNPVRTGEYIHRDKEGQIPVGITDGLENLYSSARMGSGYATIRWFDEYPVVFGFQSDEIEKYLRNQYGWQSTNVRGVNADGHRLGEIVPLSLVRAIYTQKFYMDILHGWVEQNIPGRKVISIEAASLLRTRSDERITLYPTYPYRFDEPVITDWQALAQAPAIQLE